MSGQVPTPAHLLDADLPDYQDEIAKAEESAPDVQLALVTDIAEKLQAVLEQD